MPKLTNKKKNRRFAESFTGAIFGVIIGEMARQMVQYDQVPIWRVLILTSAALVGGFVIASSIHSSRQHAAIKKHSHDNNQQA
ncbi:hypothetical protein [Aporhodopirellula aestuarii]|uniref:Uncharacterized protein n=1 Tax=Aporhodopirellula aestuarii TaxID=2950107 RepID=A0ABT0U5W7_9BACT|nr:hypothetical protein [Aporhodopirellula aestuarii]MCM2372320.1 hypothetical protein [Aporhodopirellula aestuarii]